MANPITTQIVKQFREVATQNPDSGMPRQHDARNFGFADVLRVAISEVNRSQQDADTLEAHMAQGQGHDLQDVLNSLQKASLSYQSMSKARGNLISAYQAILES